MHGQPLAYYKNLICKEEGGSHIDDITVIVIRTPVSFVSWVHSFDKIDQELHFQFWARTGGESKQHEAHADKLENRGSRPNSFR